MLVARTQMQDDDIRTAGVHMRILITVIQVLVIECVVLAYLILVFVVQVVKRDRRLFVAVDPLVHRTEAQDAQDDCPDLADLELNELNELHNDDRSQVCSQSVSHPASQHGAHVSQPATLTTGDILSDSVSITSLLDHTSIVFENATYLDLYVLYVNLIGLVLWQTLLSFNFRLYNSNMLFVLGMCTGWFLSLINSRTAVQYTLKTSQVFTYTTACVIVCSLCCSRWQQASMSLTTSLNLYMPSFLCGVFWTAVSGNMAFRFDSVRCQGILHDSKRAIPTFCLVMSVAALYSSPNTRTDVFLYIESLSRMESMHLFLIEPFSKFTSIYVTVIALERKQATNVTIALVVVQGISFFMREQSYDTVTISTLVACVLLATIHMTWISRP